MITELRTFIAVARCGTFAAAGDKIGLTQSAVSSQIKRLEDSLGFQLFDRTGRSATLNEAGVKTLGRAEDLVAQFKRLGELEDEAPAQRVLHVGAISSMQPSLLARALTTFGKKHPRQIVRLVPGPSLFLLNQLDISAIDMAVMIRPPFGLMHELRWYPLLREPFVLAVPKGFRGSDWRSILGSQPFLRHDRVTFAGRQVERFLKSQNITVRESVELDEIPGMAALVASGMGVALLPKVEAYKHYLDQVRLISLGDHTFHREIGLLSRKARSMDPVVDHLADAILASV